MNRNLDKSKQCVRKREFEKFKAHFLMDLDCKDVLEIGNSF